MIDRTNETSPVLKKLEQAFHSPEGGAIIEQSEDMRVQSPGEFQSLAEEVLTEMQDGIDVDAYERTYNRGKTWTFNCTDSTGQIMPQMFKYIVYMAVNGYIEQLQARQPGTWQLGAFLTRLEERREIIEMTQVTGTPGRMTPGQLADIAAVKGRIPKMARTRKYMGLSVAFVLVETSGAPEVKYEQGKPVRGAERMDPAFLKMLGELQGAKKDEQIAELEAKLDAAQATANERNDQLAAVLAKFEAQQAQVAQLMSMVAAPAAEPPADAEPAAPTAEPMPEASPLAATQARLAGLDDDAVAAEYERVLGKKPGRTGRQRQESRIAGELHPVEYAAHSQE